MSAKKLPSLKKNVFPNMSNNFAPLLLPDVKSLITFKMKMKHDAFWGKINKNEFFNLFFWLYRFELIPDANRIRKDFVNVEV
jgi:hypothetical protein